MTPELFDWFAVQRDRYAAPEQTKGRVLEVGSQNRHVGNVDEATGTLRPLFPSATYWGIDIEDGPWVDEVLSGRNLANAHPGWAGEWDVAIYTEVMEHDLTWWDTLDNLHWALKPGGLLFLSTCDIGFPRHDYPRDYYRFTLAALHDLEPIFGFERVVDTCAVWTESVMIVWRKPC